MIDKNTAFLIFRLTKDITRLTQKSNDTEDAMGINGTEKHSINGESMAAVKHRLLCTRPAETADGFVPQRDVNLLRKEGRCGENGLLTTEAVNVMLSREHKRAGREVALSALGEASEAAERVFNS